MALTATIEQFEVARRDEVAAAGRSIPVQFWETAAARASRTAMRWKRFGIWQAISWADYAVAVRETGCALMARGAARGERVAILSGNRTEWLYADLGVQAIGCVSVGIDVAAPIERIVDMLRDCGARVLFVEGSEQLDAVLAAKAPTLECIVHFDERVDRVETSIEIVSFSAFCASGRELHASDSERWKRELDRVGFADVASMSCEIANGGSPKAIACSHRELVRQVDGMARAYPGEGGDEQLSILPLSRLIERCFTIYRPLSIDVIVNFGEASASPLDSVREVAPHVVLATPQVFEDLHATITTAIAETMRVEQFAYRIALGAGSAVADRQAGGLRPPLALKIGHFLARLLVLNRVKTMIGLRRARWLLSVDGALSPALSAWFDALGLKTSGMQDETAFKESTAVAAEGWRPLDVNGTLVRR